jgi:hypothetical protein
MSRKVSYNIEVDASQGRREIKATSKDFEKLDKTVENAKKSSKDLTRAKKELGTEGAKGMGQLTKSSREFSSTLSSIPGPVGQLATRVQGLTKVTSTLRVSMLAIPVLALVAAFGALFQAFRSTQEGADRINRIMIPLKNVVSALWGVVQQLSIALADNLTKAFNDPMGAIRALGSAIQENIMNRFRAVIDLGGALGKVIQGLFSRDFTMMREGVSDAGSAFLQLNTGIENSGDKIRAWGNDVRQASNDAFEAGKRIQELTEQIERLRIEQEVPLARLNREYRELVNIARDEAETHEDRLAALDEGIAKRRQITAMQQQVLDLEIERLTLQQQANDTSREEELQLQRLIAQREELVASTERELGRRVSMRQSIIKSIEAEAAAEAELDEKKKQALLDQAEQFKQLLFSEEELRDQAFEKELNRLETLFTKGVLSEEEFYNIRTELRNRFFEEEQERQKQEQDGRGKVTQSIFESAAAEGDRARSAKEATKSMLKGLLDELMARALIAAFNPPTLASLALAPVMAASARQLFSSVVGFKDGVVDLKGRGTGRSDSNLARISRGESVINARSTSFAPNTLRAINSSPAAAANIERIVMGDMSSALSDVNWEAKAVVENGQLTMVMRKALREESQLGGKGAL